MTLDNLYFRHPGGTWPGLRRIRLHVASGEHVAIEGTGGCGKSALAGLLVRLWSPDSGRLLVDGIDADDVTLASLRSTVGYVPQEATLFHGTVRDNLIIGRSAATDAQLDQALRLAAADEVMLLHGHPRTHATWHRVAPLPADGYTVVCPDLRGYGESSKPPTDAEHEPYSKRAMARDCRSLMAKLGHERFAVVGHDRGGYVALRLALDHPDALTHLVAIDVVPIGEALRRCDARFAAEWYHWFFLATPDVPEALICPNPEAWYRRRYGDDEDDMGREEFEDYRRAIHDPATVHAMCEDYRAGLGIDRRHDDEDRAAGRNVSCPTLVLWGSGSGLAELYDHDVLGVWRPWATDLRGHALRGGHHLMEEAPQALAETLSGFLTPR